MRIDRRRFLQSSAAIAASSGAVAAQSAGATATWQSLAERFRVPDWFRDAKFGIWAHWGPQCQPEFGDWYGRLMYVQGGMPWMTGETPYGDHLKRYGDD